MRAQPVNPAPPRSPATRPCLYLSPDGRRCERPADEDGFCARHAGKTSHADRIKILRVLAAAALLVALLWPLAADLLRSLGWLR